MSDSKKIKQYSEAICRKCGIKPKILCSETCGLENNSDCEHKHNCLHHNDCNREEYIDFAYPYNFHKLFELKVDCGMFETLTGFLTIGSGVEDVEDYLRRLDWYLTMHEDEVAHNIRQAIKNALWE